MSDVSKQQVDTAVRNTLVQRLQMMRELPAEDVKNFKDLVLGSGIAYAFEWKGYKALVAEHTVKLIDELTLTVQNSGGRAHDLKQSFSIVKRLWENDLLRYHKWKGNSTDPTQNISSVALSEAEAEMLLVVTSWLETYFTKEAI